MLIDCFSLVNLLLQGSQLRTQTGRGKMIFLPLHCQALQKMSNQFSDRIINGKQLSLLFKKWNLWRLIFMKHFFNERSTVIIQQSVELLESEINQSLVNLFK